MLYRHSKRYF